MVPFHSHRTFGDLKVVDVLLPDDDGVPRCAHCRRRAKGYATAYSDGEQVRLCHPDRHSEMDCYHLVTVYAHPVPCDCTETDRRHYRYMGARTGSDLDSPLEDVVAKIAGSS